MKVKLYIEKILKIGVGVCGFALFTFTTAHSLAGSAEDALFEALSEGGSLNGAPSSDEKAGRGIETKALQMRLSETLWNSSEDASEHAGSQFIMDKIDLFKNENSSELRFAKEDYFDDFKENYEKGSEDKVAKDILRENKESKIERIALAAERGEGKRAEKAERNEDKNEAKVEKAEVKEEKKAEKEDKKAEKDDGDKDKKDDGDGGKKGKGK